MNNNVKLFNIDGIDMIGNFNNGAIIGLDQEGCDYIKNGELSLCPENKREEIEEALIEMGFYNEEEKKIDAAYLHVNDACNLHCIGCYSYVENRNSKKSLETKDIKIIIDSLRNSGIEQLVISGGEPFLRDDISEICYYAKNICQIKKLMVISNGTMSIQKYYSAIPYIDQLNISIDGYNEDISFIRDKGIMEKVLNTIQELKDKIEINMIVTLHRKNRNYMEDYNQLAKKMGVRFSFSIFTVDELDPLFEEYVLESQDLIEIEKNLMKLNIEAGIEDIPSGSEAINCRSRCEAGNKLISIDANGDVYPCHMLHKKELCLGNAIEKEIKEIVFSDNNPFQKINVDNFIVCGECKYKYICGGGCRGRSFLKYGSINRKDSYCLMLFNYYKDMMSVIKEKIE